MFTVNNLVQPEKKANTLLGGCCFLRMGSKAIGTAIELSRLKLNYIKEDNECIEIGAYTTFRDLETSPVLKKNFNGIIPKSIEDIIGVQFRSIVTVGASVYSKYGFSDLLPALLCLDCQVELYKGGRMSLQDFLDKPYEKDILTRIFIKKDSRKAVYVNFRNAKSDFSLLNAAVSLFDNEFTVVLGARPMGAKKALNASKYLNENKISQESFDKASELAAEELIYGSNMRASGEYRKALCSVLVKRALKEVLECR